MSEQYAQLIIILTLKYHHLIRMASQTKSFYSGQIDSSKICKHTEPNLWTIVEVFMV